MSLLFLGWLALGCQDYGLQGPEDDEVYQPILEVDPAQVVFDGAPLGDVSLADVSLSNTGNALLHVQNLAMGPATEFTLVAGAPGDIAPGSSSAIQLAFQPVTSGTRASSLLVVSDDPLRPQVEVPLQGDGLVPMLEVEPASVEILDIPLSCTHDETVTLRSVGTMDLTLSGLTVTGEGFTVSDLGLSAVLAPGEETEVTVTFAPTGVDRVEGGIWVASDDPVGSVEVALAGTGWDPHREDDYKQEGNLLDILFFVDQSGSMDDDQRSLAENFTLFTSILTDFASDYHIMAVTDIGGCHNGEIITPETEDPEAEMLDNIQASDGTGSEKGLTVVTAALSDANLGSCNAGFIRTDKVSIVLVSDEPEQSTQPWSDYVMTIQEQLPGAMLSAVAGPLPDGCDSAAAGVGFYEATVATGGVFLSICSDWGENVEDLAMASLLIQGSYVLTSEANPETVRVWVNGVEVTTGWVYSPERSSIVFDEGSEPPPGSDIHVEYEAPFSCE